MKLTSIPNITDSDLDQLKEYLNHLPREEQYDVEEVTEAIQRHILDSNGDQQRGLSTGVFDRWNEYLKYVKNLHICDQCGKEASIEVYGRTTYIRFYTDIKTKEELTAKEDTTETEFNGHLCHDCYQNE